MQNKAELAKHWRRRAEELRTIAEGIFDRAERKTLMDVADEYETLAGDGGAKITDWAMS